MKRRKYNEDLDFKVVDDDGETIAVLGTGRIPALNAATLAWQAEVAILFLSLALSEYSYYHPNRPFVYAKKVLCYILKN